MTIPVYTFGIELQTGSFTDLTTKVERASWGQTLVDMFNPPQVGRGLFELANDDGTLSPRVNSSFQPGRNVKLTATYANSTYPLFRGRIIDISMASELGNRTTLIDAVDDWDRLTDLRYTTALYSGTNVTSMFTELMSQSNVQSFMTDAIGENVGYAWYHASDAITSLHEMVTAGNYLLVVDGNGTYTLRNRNWSAFNVASTAKINTASYAMTFRSAISRDTVFNRIQIIGDQRVMVTDIQTIAYLPPAAIQTLPASSSVGFWFDFRDPGAPAETDVPVGSTISPIAGSDWYTFANSDGTGTDMTSGCALAITLYAASAVATFTNNTASLCYLTTAQVRGYPIRRAAPVSKMVDIASSQTKFGVHALTITNRLLQWDAYVGSLTTHIASDRKDGMFTADAALINVFPTVLENSVGNVFGLIDTFSGSPTSWRIRGTDHELNLTQGLQHKVSYTLDTPQGVWGWGSPNWIWAAFDPNACSANIALSGGNRTMTGDGSSATNTYLTVCGDTYLSTGQLYCEITFGGLSSPLQYFIGLAPSGYDISNRGGYLDTATSVGYLGIGGAVYSNGTLSNANAAYTTETIGMLWDADAKTVQWSKAGVLQPYVTAAVFPGPMRVIVTHYQQPAAGLTATINFGNAPWANNPPAGYVGWGAVVS